MTDFRQIKEGKKSFIKVYGVNAYLQEFKNHLQEQPGLTKEQIFEQYYQVRTETIAEFGSTK